MVLLKDLFNEAKKKPENKKRKKPTKNKPYKYTPTGFYNVYYVRCDRCLQGYTWTYKYNNKSLSNIHLNILRQEVKDKGLKWSVINDYYARKTCKLAGLPLYDLK